MLVLHFGLDMSTGLGLHADMEDIEALIHGLIIGIQTVGSLVRIRTQGIALLHGTVGVVELLLHSKWKLDLGERLDLLLAVLLLDCIDALATIFEHDIVLLRNIDLVGIVAALTHDVEEAVRDLAANIQDGAISRKLAGHLFRMDCPGQELRLDVVDTVNGEGPPVVRMGAVEVAAPLLLLGQLHLVHAVSQHLQVAELLHWSRSRRISSSSSRRSLGLGRRRLLGAHLVGRIFRSKRDATGKTVGIVKACFFLSRTLAGSGEIVVLEVISCKTRKA